MDNTNRTIKELKKRAKECIVNALYNLPEGDLDQEEYPKTLNDDLFIPYLVHFLIYIILRGGRSHFHIFPAVPSYIMHI